VKITLAYPFEGHAPDETIEIDDVRGRRMVRDGKARRADIGPDSKAADLRAYAEANKIDLAGAKSKKDIATAIERAEQTRASVVTVRSPVPPADAT
jgi:hypothetical protein